MVRGYGSRLVLLLRLGQRSDGLPHDELQRKPVRVLFFPAGYVKGLTPAGGWPILFEFDLSGRSLPAKATQGTTNSLSFPRLSFSLPVP